MITALSSEVIYFPLLYTSEQAKLLVTGQLGTYFSRMHIGCPLDLSRLASLCPSTSVLDLELSRRQGGVESITSRWPMTAGGLRVDVVEEIEGFEG